MFNAFVLSAFRYCPLIWMFCSKQAHNLINDTHFRALRAKCNAFDTPYDELLKTSNCLAVHEYNLNLMLVEVYKNMHSIGPKINWNSFDLMPQT